jgi:hypothetical protein
MKRLSFGFTTVLLFVMFSAAVVANAQPASKPSAPSATFQKVWVDYNVTEEGRSGMRIHTAFKALGMKGVSAYLQIRFQSSDGVWLKDKNGAFNHQDGSVAVFRSMKPGFDPAVYEDLDAFMPYDELDLPAGKYALKMDVDVIHEAGELIQHLTLYPFDFTQPGKTTAPVKSSTAPSGSFDRIWVDYDVTEGNRYGMRIHVKFTVYNMKNLPSYLAIYFAKADGTRLLTNNREFRSKEGQVAIYKELDIGYDPGVYSDLKLFLPYSELSLSPGKYDLEMSVDLIYKEGGLIQHLSDYEFEYTKP